MTKRACLISVDRELLIKELEFPECLHAFHAAPNVGWDQGQLREGIGEDPVNFSLHPFYLFFQSYWQSHWQTYRRPTWRGTLRDAIRGRSGLRNEK